METNRKEKIARFQTVRWQWMCDELVDSDQQEYEIYRCSNRLFVRTPAAPMAPLGWFLTTDRVGRRIRHIYRHLSHQRLEALDGAIIDLYPQSSRREGVPSIWVEGGELHGHRF